MNTISNTTLQLPPLKKKKKTLQLPMQFKLFTKILTVKNAKTTYFFGLGGLPFPSALKID